jgi:hypothetical protein
MLNELRVDGKIYTENDDALSLLRVLRRHLDQTLPDSIYLQQDELFTLKSWLLHHAESMKRGKAVWLEESTDGTLYRLVAAVGKTDDGSSVVWHEPLPWPFDFLNESQRIDADDK